LPVASTHGFDTLETKSRPEPGLECRDAGNALKTDKSGEIGRLLPFLRPCPLRSKVFSKKLL
jgi:hypothetical protein